MAKLVFGMNMSLDGFVDPLDAFEPDPALFAYFIEQTRKSAGSIYGRRLYEAMRYWDTDAWKLDDRPGSDLRAFANAWRAMPKWVVSRSLKEVGPNATLLGEDFVADVRRLKAERTGEIEVGGPALAAALARGARQDQCERDDRSRAGRGRDKEGGQVADLSALRRSTSLRISAMMVSIFVSDRSSFRSEEHTSELQSH